LIKSEIDQEMITMQKSYIFPSNPSFWKSSVWIISIGVCYFFIVKFSAFLFDIPNVDITPFWPPNGFYSAALLISPRFLWKYIISVIFVANSLGNFYIGHDWLLSFGFAIANCTEGGLIAYLFLQWNKQNINLDSFKSFFVFLASVIFSSAIGSFLGAINLSHAFGWNLFLGFSKTWFAADTLGNALMLAVILSWNDKFIFLNYLTLKKIIESIALLLSTLGLSVLIFSQSNNNEIDPLNYLVFPLLIWAALRFELKGASLIAFIVAIIAHWFTVHAQGPFTTYGTSIQDYIFWLQNYLVIMFLTAITLAVAIVERNKVKKKLQLSSRVFSDTQDSIIITDADRVIVDINSAFCKITGYHHEEVIGKNPRILNSGKQSPVFYQDMWKHISEKGYWQGELWNRKKDGEIYAELLSISSLKDSQGHITHYVGVSTNITSNKKQQEVLQHMIHYDALTLLPNRVLLADRFTQALAHSKRLESQLAVCFLDLDDFKPINDLYGHVIGDDLLIEVAQRIKSIVRDEDTASRLGGDEFVLLLGDITKFSQCEQLLNRLLASLSQPFQINELSLTISASIGVTVYPADNSDLDTLMRHADQAMYQAKQLGRNQYYLFNTKQNQLNFNRNIKLKEIESALIKNELCLYYQPKVNMASGKVFGAEALIRWSHPEKGLIPPFKFLPVIEETDLEIQVGNWVINEALKHLENWTNQGIELEVSINISSYHLQHPTFFDELKTSLAKYPQLDSNKVQLEILESSALSDLEVISSIMKTCIDTLGVSVALDDFGTGYSSLTHLRNLPAKTIKIDQTFIRNVLDDPSDLAIIDGVIGLSNSFNREIIAEGIETTNHGLMLLIMGCHEAQGYGIARPMPSTDLQNWLSDYSPNQEWLDCATNIRTDKERKLKSFMLTFAQWQKHFEKNINSEPENVEQWPILKRTNCHCGVWINRARQDYLFEDKWLNKLDEAHNTMHNIADDLFNKYQEDQIQKARSGIKDLELAIKHLSIVWGQSN